MTEIGRSLILLGVVLVVLGGILVLAGGRLPWLGRLPGDFVVRRGGMSFYFPLATCLLVSVVASLVLSFFRR